MFFHDTEYFGNESSKIFVAFFPQNQFEIINVFVNGHQETSALTAFIKYNCSKQNL